MHSIKQFVLLALTAAPLIAYTAHAAPLYCVGSVSQVTSRNNGELLFKAGYRGDFLAVCNLQTAWNGITPEQCKHWYATLLAAQLTQTPTSIYYPNTENYSGCNALPTYAAAPAPGYVMLGDAYQ